TKSALFLPLVLQLDPVQHYDGMPLDAQGRSAAGTWLIDLSSGLAGGLLGAGQSTVGHTITVQNHDGLRVAFNASVSAMPAPGAHATQAFTLQVAGVNGAPSFDLLPDTVNGQEGQPLTVVVHAADPEGDRLVYWVDGLPGGAVFDPGSQTLNWTPDFDARGT